MGDYPVERSNWRTGDHCSKLVETERVYFDFRLTDDGGKVNVYWRWRGMGGVSYALGHFPAKSFHYWLDWYIQHYDTRHLSWQDLQTLIQVQVGTAWNEIKSQVDDIAKELREEYRDSRPNR